MSKMLFGSGNQNDSYRRKGSLINEVLCRKIRVSKIDSLFLLLRFPVRKAFHSCILLKYH